MLNKQHIGTKAQHTLLGQKHGIVGTQRAASARIANGICPLDAARSVPTNCSDTDKPLYTQKQMANSASNGVIYSLYIIYTRK